ncbi:hypothetical protein ACF061_18970 [Streptomyces sp. NPDC015220]|uniref:hypothetical protein n=1 Tax=Streptomyces sp. NPDC015220 TaxID=3364947 RepID=UPI0036FA8035
MLRGKTVRTALALLATTLLTLLFLAPVTSFAPAHTFGRVQAADRAGTAPAGTVPRDERATFRDCGPVGHHPTGPLRTRDRHRATDSGPETPERPILRRGCAAAREAAAPAAGCSRTPRPASGRTPAALQVFRC